VILASLLCLLAFVQVKGPQKPPPGNNSQIKVDVDLVLVNVTVTDPRGRLVTGLEPEHFRVIEDGVEQEILHFSRDEVPVSIGLVLDVSGSMSNKIDAVRQAAVQFLRTGNPRDEFMVVQFRTRAELISPFTSSPEELESRMMFETPHGTTALYDGVYLALTEMHNAHNRRRALILVSDGGENHSRYNETDIKRFLEEADVQLYTIGVYGGAATPEEVGGPTLLHELTDLSGGRAFTLGREGVPDIVQKIGVELREEYILAYRSSNHSHDGQWRKLQIKLAPPRGLPPVKAYARSGYFAPDH
jgi:VWFA-related protein